MSETLNERMEREAKQASKLPPPPKPSRGVKLLGYLAAFAILVYGAFLFIPQSVPLLDANREVLAESPLEGFCAGVIFGQTRGYGSAEGMATCIDEGGNGRSAEKNWDEVQESFCEGLNVSMGFPTADCRDIVSTQRIWPTMKGGITQAWNKSFPYPGANALEGGVQDDSRTGDRATNDRIGESRP